MGAEVRQAANWPSQTQDRSRTHLAFRISDWTTGWGRDEPSEWYVSTGAHRPHSRSLCVPAAYQFNCTFTVWNPETGGANRSESERQRTSSSPGRER
jgi:hypothetical protein